MSLNEIGVGAGAGGLLGAVLTWLGFKSRVDNLENRLEKYGDKTVWRDTCIATHEAIKQRLDRMEQKLDEMIGYMRNGKG